MIMTLRHKMIEAMAKAMAKRNNDYDCGELRWSPYVDDAAAAFDLLVEGVDLIDGTTARIEIKTVSLMR